MYKKAAFVFLVAVCFSPLVWSQTPVYFCNRGGSKIASDRPCETFDAEQEKRLEGRVDQAAKVDPAILKMMCPILQGQKQKIMDDQYYRGVPASAKQMNELDALMLKQGCPLR